MSRSLASLPNAIAQRCSRRRRALRGGQDVGQRLADVVHVRGAVAADVVEEPRRRELRGRHRRAVGHRDAPTRDQRVGVEQRHRQVAGVLRGDLEPLHERLARHQHHEMRHPHRFRVAARARREDQHVGVHRVDLAVRRQLAGGLDHAAPSRRTSCPDTCTPSRSRPSSSGRCSASVTTIWQSARLMSEASASPRRVELIPHEHVAAEARGRHLVQEFRGVAHQHADVHRPVVIGERKQCRGTGRRVADVLAPRPACARRTSPRRRPTMRARAAIAGWSRSARR